MLIGSLLIDPPVVLAPMAGVTGLPFRLLCRRAGAGLVCSEMISANALSYGSRKTEELMATCPEERPVSLQVFGPDPDTVAAAAEAAAALGANIVDINMGCPVRKVIRLGAGAALAGDPDRAVAVARAVVRAAGVPVTAKLRAGSRAGDDGYLDLARRLAEVGLSAVALHARHARQPDSRPADWACIARLVAAVSVPVIGNGDVRHEEDVARMLRETGCAGVMIGRGALGDPFLFRRARELLAGRPVTPTPLAWRLAAALWHAQALALHLGERTALRRMRAQAGWYTKGLPGGARFREVASRVTTLQELASAVLALADSLGDQRCIAANGVATLA